jgi:aspartyl-tRNA(Asn)/glutamyl-tRNA(Gln) amidotransferase subunit A
MASSLDTIGPMARDAATCARVLEVIAGKDKKDATTVPGKPFSAAAVTDQTKTERPLEGLRVGLPKEYFAEGLNTEVERAVRAGISELEKLGATLVEVSLPSSMYGLACYYIICPAEVSSNLARFDGIRYGHSILRNGGAAGHIDLVARNRAEGFGAEAKRRIILGTFVLSAGYVDAYYKKALQLRTLLRQEFATVFEQVDLLVTPTTPNPAFKFGEKTDDPLAMYLEDIYTVSANLVGIPGLSLPAGFTQAGLPIGMQLLGKWFDEEQLLRVGHVYQQVTEWHTRRPKLSVEGGA